MPNALRSIFFKNASANIIGGASAAIFNLLLPAIAVHNLTKLEFSVWTLILQVIVYVQIFGFGLQTVITYFVARSNSTGDLNGLRDSVRAGLFLALYFTAAALFVVIVLAAVYPFFFGNIPSELTSEFRVSIAILGFSAAFQILALVPAGVFFGLHKNIVPVLSQVLVRVFSLCCLWVSITFQASLLVMSICLAASGALLVPANFFAACRFASGLFRHLGPRNNIITREMWDACSGLAVWNIAMLLVNGIDVVLVGHFDFANVAAFSLAATAVTIFVGVLQAMLNPLVAMGSSVYAKKGPRGLKILIVKASTYCSVFLVSVLVIFNLIGADLLKLWIGSTYLGEVHKVLWILLLAQAVRNIMAPFAILLVSVGLQRKALVPAIVEGAVNLCASLVLGANFGALGVAYGTLIGAMAGVFASVQLVVARTNDIVESRKFFLRKIVAPPLICITFLFLSRYINLWLS